MDKKYEIVTTDTSRYNGATIYRIKALKTFEIKGYCTVNIGDLGGYVQSEKNLSQEGNCWITDKSIVCAGAVVKENALVKDRSCIYDKAIIAGNAIVSHSIVKGSAKIIDSVNVSMDSVISGNTEICNSATVINSTIKDKVKIKNFSSVKNSTICDACVIQDSAKAIRCTISGNVVIKHNAVLMNSTAKDNVEVGEKIHVYNSILGGNSNIKYNFISKNFQANISYAIVDDKNPAIIIPVYAGSQICGLTFFSEKFNSGKDEENPVYKLKCSFVFEDEHNIPTSVDSYFSDELIQEFMHIGDCPSPQYKIKDDDISLKIKNFLFGIDGKYDNSTKNAKIFKTCKTLTDNFLESFVVDYSSVLPLSLINIIRYYIFAQLLGLSILNSIPGDYSKNKHTLKEKYEKIFNRANLDLISSEIISLNDVIPYNTELLYFVKTTLTSLPKDWSKNSVSKYYSDASKYICL